MTSSNLNDSTIDRLYQTILVAHSRNKARRRAAVGPKVVSNRQSRNCGDSITLSLAFDSGGQVNRIVDAAFCGDGCSICLAAADMACEILADTAADRALAQTKLVLTFLDHLELGESIPPPETVHPDLAAFMALARFPTRVACARLAFRAAACLLGPA